MSAKEKSDASHQPANILRPTTPLRRASSAGPPSTHRSIRRTPTAQARTPAAATRFLGSGRKPNAVTPHGRAAQRELEARRAGLTPGKDRRRSGRQQRETPRDTLRALSRLLAPKTEPVVHTPLDTKPPIGKYNLHEQDDEEDDGFELQRPRLSLPLGEEDEDEDDSLLLPPQSAGLEDENYTLQSVELGRRARSEQPLSRLSRGSFGSVRLSDRFGDLSGFGFEGYGNDSSILGPIAYDDNQDMDDMGRVPDDNTETLRDLDLDRGEFALGSTGDGDIRDDTENTFLFTVPQRDASEELVDDTAGLLEMVDEEEPDIQMNNELDQSLLENRPIDFDDNRIEDDDEPHADERDAEEPGSADNQTQFTDMDTSVQDTTRRDFDMASEVRGKVMLKKKVKVSKHGIQYPSLPTGVVKKLATTFARMGGNSKAKISKETLDAIMQASDWFFEQVSDDLGVYAQHAGRKTIDETDVVTLMARQRQTNATTTPFSLAQKYLPRELLQELRMVPPSKLKKSKQLATVQEDLED